MILLKYLLQEICGISTGTLGTVLIKLLRDHESNCYMCIISQIRSTCSEPVTVLKEYRAYFVRGRPLDLEREDTPCEGQTIEIFVSRMNIYKDAMAELVTEPPIEDISFPLEVTFIGEEAADYGGPRKEFLGAVMREVREQLFQESGSQDGEYEMMNDVAPLRQHYYYGAGLIFGKYELL